MPLVQVAGSVIGGVLGSNAANNAAKAQQQGAQQAQSLEQQNQTAAIGAQTGATQQQTANAQPYTTAGAGAISNLASLMAPGGALTQQYGQFNAPTAAQAQANPGYQFQLQQGQNALQNSAAARGGLLSSGTAKNLDQFSQGLASTDYQQVYNNALQGYNANFNTFQANQNNQYSRLMGISGLGQNSATNLNSNLQQGAQNQANIDMTGGAQQAQQINNAAAARASGYMGSANAWQGALGGITNSLGGMNLGNLGGSSSSNSWGGPTSDAAWSMM